MAKKAASVKQDTETESLETKFVNEYLVDFDPYLAAIRAGIPRLQAKPKAKALMSTASVQRALIERIDAMKVSDIVTPQRILAGLMREASASKFGIGKISALSTVHSIMKDLRAQAKEDAAANAEGKKGGVMLVPGTASLTDWEAAAMAAQKTLKEKVKE